MLHGLGRGGPIRLPQLAAACGNGPAGRAATCCPHSPVLSGGCSGGGPGVDLCPRADPEHHRLCLGDEASVRVRLCSRPGLFRGGVPLCSSQERSWVGSGASTEGKGVALAVEGTRTSSEGDMWTAGSGRKANQAEGPEPWRAGCVWGALHMGRGS